jgi:AcrR family transcriptional regulator
MAAKIIDKVQKRETILRHAMQVFARQGLHDFKMIDIADAAGIGKGTLYEYFKSKAEMIDGCNRLFLSDYSKELHSRLQKTDSPERQVSELINGTLEFFTSEPERLQLIFDIWAFTYRKIDNIEELHKLGEFFTPIRLHITNIIQRGIDEGFFKRVDSMATASILMALIDGIIFYLAMGLIDINDKNLAKNISRTFLEGLLV